MNKLEVIKQYKDESVCMRISLDRAAKMLADSGYYKTKREAENALMTGIPIQTHFAYYTLAQD